MRTATSLCFGLASCLSLAACANPNSGGKLAVLGQSVLEWEVNASDNTATVPTNPNPAYDTARLRWIGADGSISDPDYVDYDPSQGELLSIPPGMIAVQVTIIDRYPEHGPVISSRHTIPSNFAPALVWRMPIQWSDAPFPVYFFEVADVHSFEELDPILDPLIAYGPGIPIPPRVMMTQWMLYDLETDGLHVTSGTDGSWTRHDIDFNDGAWSATLADLARYTVESWDMVSTIIPFDVLDLDEDPVNAVEYAMQQDERPLVDSMLEVGN